MEPFPDWLIKHMRLQGYDQSLLARALGVTYQTVKNWLDGPKLPASTRFARVAAILQVDESELRRVVLAARERRAVAGAHRRRATKRPPGAR